MPASGYFSQAGQKHAKRNAPGTALETTRWWNLLAPMPCLRAFIVAGTLPQHLQFVNKNLSLPFRLLIAMSPDGHSDCAARAMGISLSLAHQNRTLT